MQVIFDTNAYRQLAGGRTVAEILEVMKGVRAAEAEKGVTAFVSPVVWLELFTHLADADDPHHLECLGAVVASYPHTRQKDGVAFQMLQWPFAIVEQTVFGVGHEALERQLASMDQLVGLITRYPFPEKLAQYKGSLTEFKRYAETQEVDFMRRFKETQEAFWLGYTGEKGLVKAIRGKEFMNRLVFYETVNAASGAGVDIMSLENREMERYLEIVRAYFSAPLSLFIDMMSRMVGSKAFDIEKGSRRNWYWDYQMLFHVSDRTSFFLISDDKDIRSAAEAAGVEGRVVTLEQYLGFLRAPLSEVMESHVVRITVPAGQEVDISDIAEQFGWSEEQAENMKVQLRAGAAKVQETKAGVLASIQPFYDDVVSRLGVESGKVNEILDVGKFLYFNTLPLKLIQVGESPDFVIEYDGERIGLEHTQLFIGTEQHQIGKILSLLKEATEYIEKTEVGIVGLFSVAIDTAKIYSNGRSFIDLPKLDLRVVAKELGEYIIAYATNIAAKRPQFVEGVKRYEQETLSLSPKEDFIRRGINRDELIKRIEGKEKKVERYKMNGGLSSCWLLVVYASAMSSSSIHVGLEDLPTDRIVFDRIFLMDSFSGNIIEGRVHR